MNFDPQPFYPHHPLLKKHIAYFYFLSTNEGFETRYFAFPHTHTVLNIHNHTIAKISDGMTGVFGVEKAEPMALVQGIRDFPLMAVLEGRLDKVTIIFKPMGINHFMDKPLHEVITKPSQYFSAWDNISGYHEFLNDFYAITDPLKRAELLEMFLLSCYREVKDSELIARAITMLTDFDSDISIEDISKRLHVTSRTLNRLFVRNLGISPVGYKKIARFRHSMQNNLFAGRLKRMSELAYQSNFYDQAYFNKIYRGMTGSNPQQFFGAIDQFADDQLVFQFLKDKLV